MTTSFKEMGLHVDVLKMVESLGWEHPTPIQVETIPIALKGLDLIALAQTGSGKTGAFCIPIFHRLLSQPDTKTLILSPTRELAKQIASVIDMFCTNTPTIRTALITGGTELMEEAIVLALDPHIITATPGRLVEHIEKNTSFRGLNLVTLLIVDEADMMLSLDFQPQIECILRVLNKTRMTWLFSATMTTKVNKLSRSSVKSDAVRISVSDKFTELANLESRLVLVPDRSKDLYLVNFLTEMSTSGGGLVICFTETCQHAERLSLFLSAFEDKFRAFALHGRMDALARVEALESFTAATGVLSVLFATDVASRGLDIPLVELVINYDLPRTAKEYIHRVGRTARANRTGRALTFVTKSDLGAYLEMERSLKNKLKVVEPAIDHDTLVREYEPRVIAASKATHAKLNPVAGGDIRKRIKKQ